RLRTTFVRAILTPITRIWIRPGAPPDHWSAPAARPGPTTKIKRPESITFVARGVPSPTASGPPSGAAPTTRAARFSPTKIAPPAAAQAASGEGPRGAEAAPGERPPRPPEDWTST